MRGENDPWMFHQANLRDNGGGNSLLSDLLGAVLDKYGARSTFPVVSPSMEDLAQAVKMRMSLNDSGVVATIEPGARLTVRVTNAATVPVTGLCTPSAEAYAGRQISYLQLAAGQSVTLSLTDCNGGTGGGSGSGTGGAGGGDPGAGGSGGAGGGETGTGGTGTMGQLSTDGGHHARQRDGDGWGCVVSGGSAGGGAGGLLVALALAVAGLRRRRRGQASWAMRPSLSGRSMR
jgi:MYXO-CTERM domain-containing protein